MRQDNSALKFLIVIPAYNEEIFIESCIDSLLHQTLKPQKIIVVDDSSTDNTLKVLAKYSNHPLVEILPSNIHSIHQPGAKVVNAFKRGLELVSIQDYDIICKFDADLEFPTNYLESLNGSFLENQRLGLCGGVCSVKKADKWIPETLTNLDHVRGALKAYRCSAFKAINGLNSQMGWDTADEFKLRFRKWNIQVIENLQVKHKKSTGASYSKTYFKKQGKVFHGLRYDVLLVCIAALKLAISARKMFGFFQCVYSFFNSKTMKIPYLMDKQEGKFLRTYRYKAILKKIKF